MVVFRLKVDVICGNYFELEFRLKIWCNSLVLIVIKMNRLFVFIRGFGFLSSC